MKNMLFISINDHVPWGGSEVLWSETAKALHEKVQVSVLVKKWQKEAEGIAKIKSLGISLYYKHTQNKPSFKSRVLKKVMKKDFEKNHCLEQEGLSKPDLVIISLGNHLDRQLFYYTNFLIKNKIPYVLVFQLVSDLKLVQDDVIEQFRASYLHAEKLYFLSEDNFDKVEMQLSIVFKNRDFVNNPFNYIQNYTELKPADTYNIACVGALVTFHKGQELLLKVLAKQKWKGRNLKLNLYGEGINQQQIQRLINLYDLQDKINLKGYLSDKNKIWKENVACIMPSRMEGQSLAMLEAMAHGRMVISTKVGDAERLVVPGETGFLIDAPTVALIDKTLEEAWQQRDKWISMGKQSRRHLYKIIEKDPVIDFSEKLGALL
ncbi:glycosyltransferase family 4 protein [Aestuariibaculum sp. YM273]|uniref:glycosyltransferase family 4 protein n=1 Tax=Aestuariibaculum sp. YM273 TaxID=3070659 RepID=UPI0027DC41C1|nr:glycosyltransferase family 4 protein [Aestuariibaculum sp. YM273]WMI65832.1 glycosyltransferase family 4 protein [Aestuariibaculum sp. YM273]